MTPAELDRLEQFLDAQADQDDTNGHEALALMEALFGAPSFMELLSCACEMLRAAQCDPQSVEATIALSFRFGQQWERAEQMRREFGDAEVPR